MKPFQDLLHLWKHDQRHELQSIMIKLSLPSLDAPNMVVIFISRPASVRARQYRCSSEREIGSDAECSSSMFAASRSLE
jgi:hypothetical protein